MDTVNTSKEHTARTDVYNLSIKFDIEHGKCSEKSIGYTKETDGSKSNPGAHEAADANVPVRGDGSACTRVGSTDATIDEEATVAAGYETGYAAYIDLKDVTKNVHSCLVAKNVVGVVSNKAVKSIDLESGVTVEVSVGV